MRNKWADFAVEQSEAPLAKGRTLDISSHDLHGRDDES